MCDERRCTFTKKHTSGYKGKSVGRLMAIRDRFLRLVRSPRAVRYAVGVAVLLNLPTLGSGWQLDDLTHRMFDFLCGDPEEIKAWKDIGVLPWWGNDRLKLALWRPVSSFTHVIDYTLWPDSGPLMHAQNLVWLCMLIALVGALYRRMLTVSVTGLAVLLYALDDAHGIPGGCNLSSGCHSLVALLPTCEIAPTGLSRLTACLLTALLVSHLNPVYTSHNVEPRPSCLGARRMG